MVIKKLPDEVIARISAGEVVTRPYNVLKEMIENSLDASCTYIFVKIWMNGLSIEVEDDGHGIYEDDFALFCKPYCTSKLMSEMDLFSISSYGFRGEALSSISRCSKVRVRSKRKENGIGFEAVYNNTELVSIKGVGMKDGTSIEVKDIFYNNKIREKHFCKCSSEVCAMVELVEVYAIFKNGVAFELFVEGRRREISGAMVRWNMPDARDEKTAKSPGTTLGGSEREISRKISMLNSIYKANGGLLYDEDEDFFVVFTNPGFCAKKGAFLFFVNGRLVVNKAMKNAFLGVYRNILPEKKYPVVYLELEVNKAEVDVNIHPCKSEVLFTNEKAITEKVCNCVERKLKTCEYKQRNVQTSQATTPCSSLKIYSDPMLQSIAECTEKRKIPMQGCEHEFVQRMRRSIICIDACFFKSLVYVGEKDGDTILVQHGQSLLSCQKRLLLMEYVYQFVVHNLGTFEKKTCSIKTNKVNDNFRKILEDYFCIEILEDEMVCVPVIQVGCVNDTKMWLSFCVCANSEYDVVEEVSRKISEMYSEVKMTQKLFNIVKRGIIGTKVALKCFGFVATLKELYRNFERC